MLPLESPVFSKQQDYSISSYIGEIHEGLYFHLILVVLK